jgi:hypothetical protein
MSVLEGVTLALLIFRYLTKIEPLDNNNKEEQKITTLHCKLLHFFVQNHPLFLFYMHAFFMEHL